MSERQQWYEYGIRDHKTGELHREGMTEDQADAWMTEGWNGAVPTRVFEKVRKPIGDWETCPVKRSTITAPGALAGIEIRLGITCPRCGRTSRDPADVEAGYCPVCRHWTNGVVVQLAPNRDAGGTLTPEQ